MIFFFALQGDPGMSNRHFYIENRLNVIAVNNLVERLIVWDYSFWYQMQAHIKVSGTG